VLATLLCCRMPFNSRTGGSKCRWTVQVDTVAGIKADTWRKRKTAHTARSREGTPSSASAGTRTTESGARTTGCSTCRRPRGGPNHSGQRPTVRHGAAVVLGVSAWQIPPSTLSARIWSLVSGVHTASYDVASTSAMCHARALLQYSGCGTRAGRGMGTAARARTGSRLWRTTPSGRR